MNVYEKNIEGLIKYKPKFYDKYKEHLDSYNDIDNDYGVEFLQARDNTMYMQCTVDGNITRMNSSYNPAREADRWAGQYTYNGYNNVVVMFGMGSGHFVRALAGRIKDNHIIILYEPLDYVFIKALHEIDLTDIISDDRIVLSVGNDMSDLFSKVAVFVHWANIDGLSIVRHPEYENVFVTEYGLFTDTMNKVITAIKVEGNTESYFGKEVAYNTIYNIKYIPNSHYLDDFIGRFDKDTVGIVVAAGPSLAKNVHVLHDMKDKAIIMATDTSLKCLYDEGIVPDFVVSVDPKKPVRLFENVGFENIPFMCKIDSNYKVLGMHSGAKIWVNPSEFLRVLYGDLAINIDYENSGGSVATMAFALCNMLGLKNIVLIGQDLAYLGDSTHAAGIEDHIRDEEETITYVKGNDGSMVKTRGDWKIYLEWYERVIKMLPEDTRVINATEGGAYIEGTEVMTLREVADRFCTRNLHITEIINNILDDKHEEYNEKIEAFFENCIVDIKAMVRNFEKGITLCNRFERKYKKSGTLTSEVITCMNDIGKVNKRIGAMPAYMLVDEIVKHEDRNTIKNIYGLDDDEYTSNLNMISNTRRIFELSLKAAKEIQDAFSSNVEEVKRRIKL